MIGSKYRCPLCEKEMPRDLAVYLDHTNQHIVDQIKQEHPEWVQLDGACLPCVEYYKRQLSGESADANIGPEERRKRFRLGIGMIVASLVMAFGMKSFHINPSVRLVLFVPFFFAMLGFIQAREKTCALLAERGVCNMDRGEGKIADGKIVRQLKARGRMILIKSALGAAVLTFLFLIFF